MTRNLTALRLPELIKWVAPALVFVAVLGVLALVNRSSAPSPAASSDTNASSLTRQPASLDTQGRIEQLQVAVRADSGNAGAYAALGDAYYQRARETEDATYYSRADGAFAAALARDPGNVAATTGQAILALARHDFRGGLELAMRARDLAPQLAAPYVPLADAQIELGRYAAAARTLDRLAGMKPTLSAYARISYFRELHGDLNGALQAMRLAASAGAGSPEGHAFVQGLLGELQVDRGRDAAAEHAYRAALAADPGYPPAEAGLAGLEASRGNLGAAIGRYRELVERLPGSDYALALAETEEAAGMEEAARRHYELISNQERRLRAAGVNTDADMVLLEANHGDPDHAVVLGRRAWAQAPSVSSADAYSWALHEAGRTAAASRLSAEAMRLGSRDPSFLYHAGLIARDAGQEGAARRLLGRLRAQSPRFNPLYGPRADRALADLR